MRNFIDRHSFHFTRQMPLYINNDPHKLFRCVGIDKEEIISNARLIYCLKPPIFLQGMNNFVFLF